MADYLLPDVGEGLTEAEIVSWRVKEGDVVEINDIVVEIETAKSLVELPSPYAGTVTALLVPEGETVPVGTPIISIGDPLGEAPPPTRRATGAAPTSARSTCPTPRPAVAARARAWSAATRPTAARCAARARARRRPSTEAGSRDPDAGPGRLRARRRPVAGRRRVDEPAVPAHAVHRAGCRERVRPRHGRVRRAGRAGPHGRASQTVDAAPAQRALAKPPVRKLAKDLGVDLTRPDRHRPAGLDHPRGRARRPPGRGWLRRLSRPALAARRDAVTGERERREPIKGVRKMMGQAMVDSAFTAPHVTEWVTVDVTRTMEFVERLKQRREFRDVKVSPLLVLARAAMLAMRRTPEVNSYWDDAAQEIVFKNYVNLGIAAATPRGLVVPNVKDAEQLALVDLAAALNELAATAREGKTQPAEMSGGTFTITNVGVFGVDAGTPIINPGESAILCFGAVRKQPWVVSTGRPRGGRRDRDPPGHPARAQLRPPTRRRREGVPLPRRRGGDHGGPSSALLF